MSINTFDACYTEGRRVQLETGTGGTIIDGIDPRNGRLLVDIDGGDIPTEFYPSELKLY